MLRRRSWLGLAVGLSLLPGIAQAQDNVVIFAAASLKNALDEIAATWSKDTGKPAPRISYAASPALAKQLEQGAPAERSAVGLAGQRVMYDPNDEGTRVLERD